MQTFYGIELSYCFEAFSDRRTVVLRGLYNTREQANEIAPIKIQGIIEKFKNDPLFKINEKVGVEFKILDFILEEE